MTNKTMIGVFVIAAVAIFAVGSVTAFGWGFGDHEENQDFRNQVQTAVEAGDYGAWESLMQSQITEERFAQMQEHHQQMQEMQTLREQLREAMQNGDTETADALKAQLDELMPEGMGFGHKGMGKGPGGFEGHMGECPFANADTA